MAPTPRPHQAHLAQGNPRTRCLLRQGRHQLLRLQAEAQGNLLLLDRLRAGGGLDLEDAEDRARPDKPGVGYICVVPLDDLPPKALREVRERVEAHAEAIHALCDIGDAQALAQLKAILTGEMVPPREEAGMKVWILRRLRAETRAGGRMSPCASAARSRRPPPASAASIRSNLDVIRKTRANPGAYVSDGDRRDDDPLCAGLHPVELRPPRAVRGGPGPRRDRPAADRHAADRASTGSSACRWLRSATTPTPSRGGDELRAARRLCGPGELARTRSRQLAAGDRADA